VLKPVGGWNFPRGRGHYGCVVVAQTGWDLTDEQVVARSLGEPEAFGVLFDRHGDDVFRFLASQMSPEAAEDATSEVFVGAFRARGTYRGQAPPRAWLFGIAANVARRQWRSRRRFEMAVDRLQALASYNGRLGDDPLHRREELSQTVREALESLPHNQRDALVLRAWGGLTYEEIAIVLGVRVGTVRSRINRARTALATTLTTTGDPR
jgi:RNA polymerase sigma factor (sigma-70 family)